MNKILASIVTYNPDIEILKKNIHSFSDDVLQILIVDNNSLNNDEILRLQNNNIKVISNKTNVGIAKALNIALEFADKFDYDYLLTMDQDSYFDSKGCVVLLDGFIDDNIAIVSPSLLDVNSGNLNSVNDLFEKIFTTITSGSLCSVKILVNIGGFMNELFIDYVDIEICLRLQKKGFTILRSKDCILNHQLGESKVYSFLGFNFISTNHYPLRRYYYARNKVFIYRKYLFSFSNFVIRDIFSFIKTVFIILVFENKKTSKLRMIVKGVYHGFLKFNY
jgi:rhamnosyltransferase